MGAVLEAVLAVFGLAVLVAQAARPYLEDAGYDLVTDPAAEALESIGERHQAADAAMRQAAGKEL